MQRLPAAARYSSARISGGWYPHFIRSAISATATEARGNATTSARGTTRTTSEATTKTATSTTCCKRTSEFESTWSIGEATSGRCFTGNGQNDGWFSSSFSRWVPVYTSHRLLGRSTSSSGIAFRPRSTIISRTTPAAKINAVHYHDTAPSPSSLLQPCRWADHEETFGPESGRLPAGQRGGLFEFDQRTRSAIGCGRSQLASRRLHHSQWRQYVFQIWLEATTSPNDTRSWFGIGRFWISSRLDQTGDGCAGYSSKRQRDELINTKLCL